MTLINYVLQNSAIYTMSTFKIPTSVCEAADTLFRKLWWTDSTEVKHYFPHLLGTPSTDKNHIEG